MAANDRAELAELRRLDELEAKAAGKPAASPQTTPDAGAAATMAAEGTPEWERRAAGVGRAMSAPFEAVGQIYEHLRGRGAAADTEAQDKKRAMDALETASAKETEAKPSAGPLGDIINKANAGRLGTTTDLTAGMLLPAAKIPGVGGALGRVLSGAATGAGYSQLSPVTGGGDFATEKAKQAGVGAATGGVLTGLTESLSRIPGMFKKTPATERQTSDAAATVTGELQRIKDKIAGKETPTFAGQPASEFETLSAKLDQETAPLRDKAFKSGAKVDVQPALTAIEKMRGQTTNPSVLKALDDADSIIRDAIKKSGPATLPERMSANDYKDFIASGGGQKANIALLDESRQAINELVSGAGGREHGPFAQKQLLAIQDALRTEAEKASPEYGKYLTKYAQNAAALDKFKASPVLGKLTSEAGRFAGSDAQDALGAVFSGRTRERDFKELGDLTKHDPKALAALKQSIGDFVTKPEATTGVVSTENLLKRWDKVRGPAQKAGLIEPKHIKLVDSLMDDLIKLKGKKGMQRDVATVGGFFAGMGVGHPFMLSHFARDMAGGKTDTSMLQKNATEIIMSLAVGDAEKAALLAKPPTPANVSEFLKSMEGGLAAGGGLAASPEGTPPTRRLRDLQGGLGGHP